MRSFEFARKIVDGKIAISDETSEIVMAYPQAQLPEYSTARSAGADFFCAEDTAIKPIWESVFNVFGSRISSAFKCLTGKVIEEDERKSVQSAFAPTLIHTGIKASMEEDEVLEIYNRSSNPKKLGLVLANGVGVIDADYYNNTDNDGEIMFAFYNILPWTVTIKAGDRIGQGVFKKYLRPTEGLRIKDAERKGGFGSTGM